MKQNLPLSILLSLVFLLGVVTLADFGESWDEWQFYKYADRALESYGTWFQRGEVKVTGNTYDNYGPAYVITAQQFARLFHSIHSDWLVSDLRHLFVFIGFLAGAAAFHAIAKRWMPPVAAFAATLLFLTQPLLWGHAFISPKDIPFLSLFLISIALGLHMVDSKPALDGRPPRWLIWLTAVWLVSLIFLFVTPYIFDNALAGVLQDAHANPAHLIGGLIRSVASDFDTVPVKIYITKARVFLIWAKIVYLFVVTGILAWIYRKVYPLVVSLLKPPVLLASLALGLTSSTRILGPLAGLLVVYYALRALGRRSLPMLAVYLGLSFAVMLASWPYLWPDPPARIQESLETMSTYPWEGSTLFKGDYYLSTELPTDYLPVLLLLQITEPVWLLCIAGILMLRKTVDALVTTLIWFVLPLIALIIIHAPLYDNTRQIFFILPPVFLVAGLGVEWLLKFLFSWKWLSTRRSFSPFLQVALITLLILPGLVAGIRLHPYEYVYYNSMVGDPTGKYELEYWGTSFREASNWLNDHAPANSRVVGGVPSHLAELYLRPDLKAIPIGDYLDQPVDYDYVILSTRHDNHKDFFIQDRVVFNVERNGMLFAVVKQRVR